MDISCGMVENEKKSKKGKIKKIDGRLLLVLVARVVVNCGIWHIVVEVFFFVIYLFFWSTASAIIFLSKGSGLQGLGSHFILPSEPHMHSRQGPEAIPTSSPTR